MKFIAHRINTIEELKKIPKTDGCEIDIRPFGKKLILAHDPFQDGEELETFLQNYDHGTLILNIKSERIELEILPLLKKYNITNYFFLDSSLPMINLLINDHKEPNIAIRFSEIEPIELLEAFSNKIKWVWVDCFTKFILTKEIEEKIHSLGFKICIVSPELQGRDSDIEEHSNIIKDNNIKIDYVCSKIYNKKRWLK